MIDLFDYLHKHRLVLYGLGCFIITYRYFPYINMLDFRKCKYMHKNYVNCNSVTVELAFSMIIDGIKLALY